MTESRQGEAASLLLLGEKAQRAEDYLTAKRCYESALALTPDNWAGHLNLAVTDIRLFDVDGALEHLRFLRSAAADHRGDPAWVSVDRSVAYNEALARWYEAAHTAPPDRTQLGAARDVAHRLVLNMLEAWKVIKHQPLLARLEGPALTLLAALIAEGHALGHLEEDPSPEPDGRRGREHLLALLRATSWTDLATGEELTTFALRKHDDAITHYNAAVYYTRRLAIWLARNDDDARRADLSAALQHLTQALELDDSHGHWAHIDPLLKPLHVLDPTAFHNAIPHEPLRSA